MARISNNYGPVFAYIVAHPEETLGAVAATFEINRSTLGAAVKHEADKPGGGRLAGHPTYGKPSTSTSQASEAAAVYVPIAELVPWVKNPRKNDAAAESVADSIVRFGFGAPLLARLANREVIAGHTRIKAARILPARHRVLSATIESRPNEEARRRAAETLARWHPEAVALATDKIPRLPVRYRDLSEDEAHALALADNRTNEFAAWDADLLGSVLRDFGVRDVSTDAIGWDAEAIAQMTAPPPEPPAAKPGGGDALPGGIAWPSEWPEPLKAPFPWFGGKLRAAPLIWAAFGVDVSNYVEAFVGSCATLLARPPPKENADAQTETINDADGFVVNFWRALAADPESLTLHADWPVSEADLSARHLWLLGQRAALTERLQVDPTFYDAQIAGWWVWGICAWIGSGWCSGDGPWTADDAGGGWVNRKDRGSGDQPETPAPRERGEGVGTAGQGINRQLPHLGDAGQGINRQLPHLGDVREAMLDEMCGLAARLRRVRITCGDWRRVLSDSVTIRHGVTAILLDPPYPDGFSADGGAYSAGSAGSDVWHQAAAWAVEHGGDPRFRIVLCGYAGTWTCPPGWREIPWKARGGYGSAGTAGEANSHRERLWLSPGCLDVSGVIE